MRRPATGPGIIEVSAPAILPDALEAMCVPPHSVAAEQSVLGGLMLDHSRWADVAERLREEDFYRQEHRLLFRAISELAKSQLPFDTVTVSEWLQRRGQLEQAGGFAYLGTLQLHTATAANVCTYADIVHQCSMRRQLIPMNGEGVDAARTGAPPAAEIAARFTASPAPHARAQNGLEVLGSPRAVTRRITDIPTERLAWLWPSRIPLGKVTVFSGDPGLGKSLVTLAIAAAVSCGSCWPCREGTAPLGDVMLVSAEDDPADTIRPRLEAANADLHRIHVLDAVEFVDADGRPQRRPWNFTDMDALGTRLAALPECRLVIVDPLSAYLAGTDSHKNSDVRALLAPLAEMASRQRVAVLCVSHLNKSAGPAMYRTTGSLAFVAAARAVYGVAKDPNNASRRLVVPIKCNLSADSTGLAYKIIANADGTPVIEWESETVTISAEEAFSVPAYDDEQGERREAVEWLTDYLAGGPKSARQVRVAAQENGLAWRTVRRAQVALNIRPAKTRFDGGWEWTLPAKVPTDPEDVHLKNVDTFDEVGHLRQEEGVL